jgi:hypothetical protein
VCVLCQDRDDGHADQRYLLRTPRQYQVHLIAPPVIWGSDSGCIGGGRTLILIDAALIRYRKHGGRGDCSTGGRVRKCQPGAQAAVRIRSPARTPGEKIEGSRVRPLGLPLISRDQTSEVHALRNAVPAAAACCRRCCRVRALYEARLSQDDGRSTRTSSWSLGPRGTGTHVFCGAPQQLRPR